MSGTTSKARRAARGWPRLALVALLLGACAGPGAEPTAEPTAEPAPDPPGKWRQARRDAAPTPTEEETARLVATPYLQGYRRAQESPVVPVHDRQRAQEGLNLYVSGHAAEAVLMDMDGRMRHRWRYDLAKVWPDLYEGNGAETARRLEYWRRAALLPDGSLLAIYEGLGLVKLDRRSRLQWAHRGGIHHDLFVRPDGEIWALDRRSRVLPRFHPSQPVLEDLITVFGPDGSPRRSLSLVDAFARSPYVAALQSLAGREGDVTHTNTLERIEENPIGAAIPAFRPGNLLVSVHQLDLVAVVDPDREEVVWALSGLWHRQHQPVIVPGGQLLVFDNLGLGDRSRAIEIDPATQRVTWSWPEEPTPERLFSRTLGSVQRLANGNTLITESENGRALEVTREGEVVWELVSPHRAGARNELVATLFEVERLAPTLPWLDGGAPVAGD